MSNKMRLGLATVCILVVLTTLAIYGAGKTKEPPMTEKAAGKATDETSKLPKTEAEWRKVLTPEQFYVTRQKGTERAFTGEHWNTKASGTYRCVCCEQPLFSSETKYDSGTGWPSFWEPIAAEAVKTEEDRSLFSVRTEVLCSRCDAHLGHVFDDGPAPTGLRYCMNSAALKFEEKQASR